MTRGESGPGASLDIRWSDQAKDDLAAIGDYIAADDSIAAMRWVDLLIADVERAAQMPFAGHAVPEYSDRQDIREVVRRNYRIVYRVGDDAIEVLTVFEGHRVLPRGAVPDG